MSEIIFVNVILAAFCDGLFWVVVTCIPEAVICYFLAKPIAVTLVFFLALVLGAVHHVSIILRHNYSSNSFVISS